MTSKCNNQYRENTLRDVIGTKKGFYFFKCFHFINNLHYKECCEGKSFWTGAPRAQSWVKWLWVSCESSRGKNSLGRVLVYVNLWEGNCLVCLREEYEVQGLPLRLSGKESTCNGGYSGDRGSIPESGRSPGGGNRNLLQYSCLKISWTEEPGRLQSMVLQRVRHNWAHYNTKCKE